MKRILFSILLLLPVCIASEARIVYGPWIHGISETGFTVLWTTRDPSLAWVEIAPDDGSDFYACERERFYETVAGRRVSGTFHKVEISSLEAGTAYRYRLCEKKIADDSNAYAIAYGPETACRPVSRIRTLDRRQKVCRFAMLNDIHERDSLAKTLLKTVCPSGIDFLVLNGDIVNSSESIDSVMKHSFGPVERFIRNVPLVFARGNHEGRGRDFHRVPELFSTPTGEFYYTFRHGPVAFIVLDAGEDKPDSDVEYSGTADYDSYREKELKWLKTALQTEEVLSARFKVVLIHIPAVRREHAWYAQKWELEQLLPVLNNAGISLMLSGHQHKREVIPAGELGNNFPIVINDDEERLDFEADSSSISVSAANTEGKKFLLIQIVA